MTTNKRKKGLVAGKAKPMKMLRMAKCRQFSHDAETRYTDYGKKICMGYLTVLSQKLEAVRTMSHICTNFGGKLLVGDVRMKRSPFKVRYITLVAYAKLARRNMKKTRA